MRENIPVRTYLAYSELNGALKPKLWRILMRRRPTANQLEHIISHNPGLHVNGLSHARASVFGHVAERKNIREGGLISKLQLKRRLHQDTTGLL
tara:strand:- start:4523 stop:4804 length:282 start_codon:yes stop_codon:yes gene_type:complete